MKWAGRAACLDEDPEMFFPIGTSGPALDQAERAKAVCARCQVAIAHCLEWAIATRQDAGVWGGMDNSRFSALRQDGLTELSRRGAF